jgi:GTP pyrophosphokinase
MVKVRDITPRGPDGHVDLAAWAEQLCVEHSGLQPDPLRRAGALVRRAGALVRRGGVDVRRGGAIVRNSGDDGERHLDSGVTLAQLVAELHMDTPTVVAALVYRPFRKGLLTHAAIVEELGEDVAQLVTTVARMATTSILEMSNTRMQTIESRDQVDNVRRMLVSLIDDARVAVLKLAERIVALRLAKTSPEARQQRIAREAHLIFAPLANRLGIWQLKWELEDLALRYLEPDVYMSIARQLDGRRGEREEQVSQIVKLLEDKLRDRNIDARVSGRAKHIFSIFRKMRTKHVGIEEVYDVRAVRILVPDIAQCYATLGVVHTQWQHISSEFDDYIAAPKDNGYRSIHTAVMGPGGKTLEVQIRTHEMHEEAELGVCAHWVYKDGVTEDGPLTEKMKWLRQVVEWQDEAQDWALNSGDLSDELAETLQEDRIFVYTPQGHVLDLTAGATPVDFAYRVHTEVGHRCTGARVDGRPVSLNTPLQTGQRVEVITAKYESPERCWLDKQFGYVRTARARDKIQGWFRERPDYENRAYGIATIADMMDRLCVARPDSQAMQNVASDLGFEDETAVACALAVGDCPIADVVECLYPSAHTVHQLSLLPEPGEQAGADDTYSVAVEAHDREGLLRDVTALLSEQRIPLLANTGRVDLEKGMAHISLELRLAGLRDLAVIIEQLRQIPDMVDARRANV